MSNVESGLDFVGIDGGKLLFNLVFALAVYIAARALSRVLRHRIVRSLSRQSFGRNGAVLLGRVVSILVYVVASLVVLMRFGVSSTGILTFLGAFSVALGLALQDVFRNFFSGILLLMERPFRVGDHIKVRDVEGEVQGIDVRTTLVRRAEGTLVLVPNSIVFAEIMTNRSASGFRRIDLKVIANDLSAMELEAAIHASLENLEQVRRPIPAPIVRSITSESVTLELSVVVDDAPEVPGVVMSALASGPLSGKIEVSRI